MAARSGREPLVVVCLLHQGFNAYAEQLAPTSQREWEKIGAGKCQSAQSAIKKTISPVHPIP
jgi:hypothetical protein